MTGEWITSGMEILITISQVPVSYTHLTLPTIYSVYISVVAVPLKKKNNH